MIVGHLPAGYLLTRTIQRHFPTSPALWIGLTGSIFPDADLLWFYGMDHRQQHHHSYFTHLPIFWLLMMAVLLPLARACRPALSPAVALFLCNGLLHVVLDTWVGDIRWLYPWSDRWIHVVSVPATHEH